MAGFLDSGAGKAGLRSFVREFRAKVKAEIAIHSKGPARICPLNVPGDVTSLLNRWRDGDSEAFQKMVPFVYQELRAIAEGYIRRERFEHTLQPTALVHELYLKLVHQRQAAWNDREHFFAFAARLMRFLLIDHARTIRRKGDRGETAMPLHEDIPWLDTQSEDMVHLDVVLDELESVDPKKLRLVEIRYFLGCTAQETAELMGVSASTVNRDLRFVRSWMLTRLRGDGVSAAGA